MMKFISLLVLALTTASLASELNGRAADRLAEMMVADRYILLNGLIDGDENECSVVIDREADGIRFTLTDLGDDEERNPKQDSISFFIYNSGRTPLGLKSEVTALEETDAELKIKAIVQRIGSLKRKYTRNVEVTFKFVENHELSSITFKDGRKSLNCGRAGS